MNFYKLVSIGLMLLYLCNLGILSVQADNKIDHIGLKDGSDKWLWFPRFSTKPQKRKISNSNLQILGISLEKLKDEEEANNFKNLSAKLGKATTIELGDAATSQMWICYKSIKDRVWLIWGVDEMGSSFDLCTDCPNWTGDKYTVPCKLISRDLATASGLHLGQTPEQVIAILGKPNVHRRNELYYWLHSREKTPEKDLLEIGRLRSYSMSDEGRKELHEAYGFYGLDITIYAKFFNGRLIHLGVSRWRSDP